MEISKLDLLDPPLGEHSKNFLNSLCCTYVDMKSRTQIPNFTDFDRTHLEAATAIIKVRYLGTNQRGQLMIDKTLALTAAISFHFELKFRWLRFSLSHDLCLSTVEFSKSGNESHGL